MDPVGSQAQHRPGERPFSRCKPPGSRRLASDDGKLLCVAADERGRELEIIAVPLGGGDLLVIHVMPTILRRWRNR